MGIVEFLLILSTIILGISVILPKRKVLIPSIFILLLIMAYRTYAAGYPLTFEPFDTYLLFCTTLELTLLWLNLKGRIPFLIILLTSFPLLFFGKTIHNVPPIVKTPLFILHVSSSLLGYCVFLSLSIAALISIKEMNVNFKPLTRIGIFLFTFSLFIGGIWAFLSWGDILPFDPKTLFSVFMWLYFSAILHVNDKKLEYTGYIAGGFIVMFTFLGVNFLLGGSHGF